MSVFAQAHADRIIRKHGRRVNIPRRFTVIDQNAFVGQILETITLPDSIKTIRSGAFWGIKGLKSVTFGANLQKIGARSFSTGLNRMTYLVA